MKEILISKFQARDATVAVIGLGYVGLPLALNFAKAGYQVVGIDVDQRKVDAINAGHSYIGDVTPAELAPYVRMATAVQRDGDRQLAMGVQPAVAVMEQAQGSLWVTTDFAALADCDAVSICVPTPLNKTGDPDKNAEHFRLADIDRLHRRIGRLEADPVALREPLLERRLAILGLGDDDVAGVGRVAATDHHPVTIGDLGLDHRIAHHLEDEMVVLVEELIEVDPLLLLVSGAERARRHPPGHREAAEMGWFGDQFDRPGHVLPPADQPLPLEGLEMADDTVGRTDVERLTNLPDRRAVAAVLDLVADEGVDLELPLGRGVNALIGNHMPPRTDNGCPMRVGGGGGQGSEHCLPADLRQLGSGAPSLDRFAARIGA